jgi:hypothetical protein
VRQRVSRLQEDASRNPVLLITEKARELCTWPTLTRVVALFCAERPFLKLLSIFFCFSSVTGSGQVMRSWGFTLWPSSLCRWGRVHLVRLARAWWMHSQRPKPLITGTAQDTASLCHGQTQTNITSSAYTRYYTIAWRNTRPKCLVPHQIGFIDQKMYADRSCLHGCWAYYICGRPSISSIHKKL